jgi:hypothetical protein
VWFGFVLKEETLMDQHAWMPGDCEAAAAAAGMAETYGTDADTRQLADGMAVEGDGWSGWVEWIDGDRVTVQTDRHAWIAYSRSEVRRAAR